MSRSYRWNFKTKLWDRKAGLCANRSNKWSLQGARTWRRNWTWKYRGKREFGSCGIWLNNNNTFFIIRYCLPEINRFQPGMISPLGCSLQTSLLYIEECFWTDTLGLPLSKNERKQTDRREDMEIWKWFCQLFHNLVFQICERKWRCLLQYHPCGIGSPVEAA